MGANRVINAVPVALFSHAPGVPAPVAVPVTPVLPVAEGHDDSAMMFRSLIDQGRGAAAGMQAQERVEALAAFDRMARIHPVIFAQVMVLGGLGYVSQSLAISKLMDYSLTGCATSPVPF